MIKQEQVLSAIAHTNYLVLQSPLNQMCARGASSLEACPHAVPTTVPRVMLMLPYSRYTIGLALVCLQSFMNGDSLMADCTGRDVH